MNSNTNENLFCNKIIQYIDSIFISDLLLKEFGFILEEKPCIELATLDISHIVVHIQHNLGLVSYILKPLYIYAMKELQSYINILKDRPIHVDVNILANLQMLTRTILLIKGDQPIAINYRKLLIKRKFITSNDELIFMNILFTKHPKSPSCWQHRRYCLEHLDNQIQEITALSEIQICTQSAELYPKNYYAWVHRLIMLKYISLESLEGELDFISLWLYSHISDHSAINHYYQVLKHLIDREDIVFEKYFIRCIQDNHRLIVNRPDSESFWLLRRSFMTILLPRLMKCQQVNDSLITSLRQIYIAHNELDIQSHPIDHQYTNLIQVVYSEYQFVHSFTSDKFEDDIIKYSSSYLLFIFYMVCCIISYKNIILIYYL